MAFRTPAPASLGPSCLPACLPARRPPASLLIHAVNAASAFNQYGICTLFLTNKFNPCPPWLSISLWCLVSGKPFLTLDCVPRSLTAELGGHSVEPSADESQVPQQPRQLVASPWSICYVAAHTKGHLINGLIIWTILVGRVASVYCHKLIRFWDNSL